MKTSLLIERASFALRKFRHAETCPAQGTEPVILVNKQTGDVAVGCAKCNKAINLTSLSMGIDKVAGEAQVKPRFKI